MGLGPVDGCFLSRIEAHADKLALQLEWFPTNNTRYFTHETCNKLTECAVAALKQWLRSIEAARLGAFDVGMAEAFLSRRWIDAAGDIEATANLSDLKNAGALLAARRGRLL